MALGLGTPARPPLGPPADCCERAPLQKMLCGRDGGRQAGTLLFRSLGKKPEQVPQARGVRGNRQPQARLQQLSREETSFSKQLSPANFRFKKYKAGTTLTGPDTFLPGLAHQGLPPEG